jgi:SAM-dependent methyltransferase
MRQKLFSEIQQRQMDISQFELHAKIEDIHWWFKARREIMFDQLKKYVPPGERKVIAEVGCGTGGNLKFLKNYYHVIGVDISPEAVKYTKERVNCSVFLGDFRIALKGSWDAIDAVILADVLEHIEDDGIFLREIIQYLKLGAALLITVPAHGYLWSEHDVILGHKRRYSVRNLRYLWKDLPMKELFFSPFNCLFFPAIVLYRMLKRGSASRGKSDLHLPSSVINNMLYKIFSAERALLKLSPLPWGVSYLALLRKMRD